MPVKVSCSGGAFNSSLSGVPKKTINIEKPEKAILNTDVVVIVDEEWLINISKLASYWNRGNRPAHPERLRELIFDEVENQKWPLPTTKQTQIFGCYQGEENKPCMPGFEKVDIGQKSTQQASFAWFVSKAEANHKCILILTDNEVVLKNTEGICVTSLTAPQLLNKKARQLSLDELLFLTGQTAKKLDAPPLSQLYRQSLSAF